MLMMALEFSAAISSATFFAPISSHQDWPKKRLPLVTIVFSLYWKRKSTFFRCPSGIWPTRSWIICSIPWL